MKYKVLVKAYTNDEFNDCTHAIIDVDLDKIEFYKNSITLFDGFRHTDCLYNSIDYIIIDEDKYPELFNNDFKIIEDNFLDTVDFNKCEYCDVNSIRFYGKDSYCFVSYAKYSGSEYYTEYIDLLKLKNDEKEI